MSNQSNPASPANPGNPANRAARIELQSWPTWVTFAGLLMIYLGERAIGEPQKLRLLADAVGGLLLLAALGARLSHRGAATDENHRRAEGWLLLSQGVLFIGLLLYFGFATWKDGLQASLGKSFEQVDGIVATLWPALLLGGGLCLAQMQRALLSMTDGLGAAEHVELQRLRYSTQSGVTVALVLIFCFAVNYTAAERNHKWDMARFRSTRPSQATRKVVQNLGKTVRATLFFPNPNEVREEVLPYFNELGAQSPSFKVEVLDHALEPQRAKELSATGNGLVVLAQLDDKGQPGPKETLNLGTKLESATTALGSLDGDVQKKLLQLTRPGRIAYFTVGHGERGFERSSAQDMTKDDLRSSVGDLRSLLVNQGYDVRTLGIGQGLGTKVPGDAGIVFIAGPTDGFLPEEVNALTEYLSGGGHVFLLLDPGAPKAAEDLNGVLKSVGLKYHPEVLCNSEVYAVRTHKAADHANIAAVSFSSHASVTTISRAAGRAAVILPRAGWVESDPKSAGGATLDLTVRSMPNTWADQNGDFEFQPTENRRVYDLAGIASKTIGDPKDKKELRLAVLGSVDAAGDLVLGNRANLFLVLDTIKWLMGEEALAGETAQETDLPIVHTKSEDKLWFYSTIFAAPVLILIGGLLYTRKARRRRAS